MKSAGTGRQNLYAVLLIAALVMFIWLYSQYALLIISTVYVTHGIIGWLYRSLFIKPRVASEAA
jgi:hypothetical protein